MLVLGDIAAIVALFGVGAFAVWGIIMLAVLLLGERTGRAKQTIQQSPWKIWWVGVAAMIVAGGGTVMLLAIPNPIVKLIGVVSLGVILVISSLGIAGLARGLADRIRSEAGGQSGYWALSRAAIIITACCLLPVVGWFLFAPVALIFGFGAGVMSLRPARVMAPPIQAPEAL